MKETTVLTTRNFTKLLLSCFIAGWYNTQGRFRVLTLQDTSGKARHKLIVRCAVPQSHGFSLHSRVTPRHVAFQMAEAPLPAEGALRPWWCVWPSPIWGRFWGRLLRTSRGARTEKFPASRWDSRALLSACVAPSGSRSTFPNAKQTFC